MVTQLDGLTTSTGPPSAKSPNTDWLVYFPFLSLLTLFIKQSNYLKEQGHVQVLVQ